MNSFSSLGNMLRVAAVQSTGLGADSFSAPALSGILPQYVPDRGTTLLLRNIGGAPLLTTFREESGVRALAVLGTAWLWLDALPDEDVDFPFCALLTG